MRKTKAGKLKIAMLGHKRMPSREGGAEVVAGNLAVRFAAQGHTVTSYNRWSDRKSPRLKCFKGVRLVYVPTVKTRGLSAALAALGAAVLAAFGSYDVVHIHSEGPAALAFLPKLLGKKVVVTIHGLDHQRAKWGPFASWCLRFGERMAVRYADEIIVLSRNVQEYFRKMYGRETVYIPNGASPKEAVPARVITERWGLTKDSYVLFLGRLVPEKGLCTLIKAWNMLEEEKKQATDSGAGTDRAESVSRGGKKLVIAGGSADTDAFVLKLKEMAGSDVLFTGFVKGAELAELYSNAFVYVLPSDLEGMPLTLLEAMSYGNCCLTSDIPECTEVTEDKAVSFRRGDAADLRDKLAGLLADPQTVEAYRKDAQRFICGKYSWDKCAQATMEVYRKSLR